MPDSRKALQHVPPVAARDSWFFITICCQARAQNQLCTPGTAAGLIEDATLYHRQRRWTLFIFLLMPDHLHMIAGFPREESMSEFIRSWKRLTARRHPIVWQRNYFDHRVRPDEGLRLKSDYIRQNPVRAGLATRPEDWPHCVEYISLEGR